MRRWLAQQVQKQLTASSSRRWVSRVAGRAQAVLHCQITTAEDWRSRTCPARDLAGREATAALAVFRITCNTPVRSSRRQCMGRYRGAPTAARTAGPGLHIPLKPGSSKSLLRSSDVTIHMHTRHAPPPEPNRARIIWRN